MAIDSQVAAAIRRLNAGYNQIIGRIGSVEDAVRELLSRPRSPVEEIDAQPGRRIESALVGQGTFSGAGRQAPIVMQVSQDGPFVATHYPLVAWFPDAPNTATNLNKWRPVATWPLPTQVVGTDIIDIQYEMQDAGPGRNFQNAPRGLLLSRPDALMPLPIPTLYATATVLQFIPTVMSVTFNGATPPTEGTIHVTIPGYRIVNM